MDDHAEIIVNLELEMSQAERIEHEFRTNTPDISTLFRSAINRSYQQDVRTTPRAEDQAKIKVSISLEVRQANLISNRFKKVVAEAPLGAPTDQGIYELVDRAIERSQA